MKARTMAQVAALRPATVDSGPELTLDEVSELMNLLDGKRFDERIVKSARKRLERQYLGFIPF